MSNIQEKIEKIVKTNAEFFDWELDSEQSSELRNAMEFIAQQAYEEGNADGMRGKIQRFKSIEIKETLQIPQALIDKIKEQERMRILEELPGQRNKPHTEPHPELKGWDVGFNDCLSQVKSLVQKDN